MRLLLCLAALVIAAYAINEVCHPFFVRWPRVRLNAKAVAGGRLGLRACQSACAIGEDPVTPGKRLECAAMNHETAADRFSHKCDVFQPHQLQNLDGYVEADDRYSFYWKYCLETDRKCGGEYAFTYLSDRYMDRSEVVSVQHTSTLEDCLTMCLDSASFPCRSVSFNRTDGGCHLSSDSQLTKPQSIHLNNNPNYRIDYYENNCYNMSETFKFDYQCKDDGILVTIDSKFPYTGALYGLYDFFTCRTEPKEMKNFEFFFPSPMKSKNCSDSIRYKGNDMVLEVVLSTDGVEPLYFITPDDLTFQARCPIHGSRGNIPIPAVAQRASTDLASPAAPATPAEQQQFAASAHALFSMLAKQTKDTFPLPLTTAPHTLAPTTKPPVSTKGTKIAAATTTTAPVTAKTTSKPASKVTNPVTKPVKVVKTTVTTLKPTTKAAITTKKAATSTKAPTTTTTSSKKQVAYEEIEASLKHLIDLADTMNGVEFESKVISEELMKKVNEWESNVVRNKREVNENDINANNEKEPVIVWENVLQGRNRTVIFTNRKPTLIAQKTSEMGAVPADKIEASGQGIDLMDNDLVTTTVLTDTHAPLLATVRLQRAADVDQMVTRMIHIVSATEATTEGSANHPSEEATVEEKGLTTRLEEDELLSHEADNETVVTTTFNPIRVQIDPIRKKAARIGAMRNSRGKNHLLRHLQNRMLLHQQQSTRLAQRQPLPMPKQQTTSRQPQHRAPFQKIPDVFTDPAKLIQLGGHLLGREPRKEERNVIVNAKDTKENKKEQQNRAPLPGFPKLGGGLPGGNLLADPSLLPSVLQVGKALLLSRQTKPSDVEVKNEVAHTKDTFVLPITTTTAAATTKSPTTRKAFRQPAASRAPTRRVQRTKPTRPVRPVKPSVSKATLPFRRATTHPTRPQRRQTRLLTTSRATPSTATAAATTTTSLSTVTTEEPLAKRIIDLIEKRMKENEKTNATEEPLAKKIVDLIEMEMSKTVTPNATATASTAAVNTQSRKVTALTAAVSTQSRRVTSTTSTATTRERAHGTTTRRPVQQRARFTWRTKAPLSRAPSHLSPFARRRTAGRQKQTVRPTIQKRHPLPLLHRQRQQQRRVLPLNDNRRQPLRGVTKRVPRPTTTRRFFQRRPAQKTAVQGSIDMRAEMEKRDHLVTVPFARSVAASRFTTLLSRPVPTLATRTTVVTTAFARQASTTRPTIATTSSTTLGTSNALASEASLAKRILDLIEADNLARSATSLGTLGTDTTTTTTPAATAAANNQPVSTTTKATTASTTTPKPTTTTTTTQKPTTTASTTTTTSTTTQKPTTTTTTTTLKPTTGAPVVHRAPARVETKQDTFKLNDQASIIKPIPPQSSIDSIPPLATSKPDVETTTVAAKVEVTEGKKEVGPPGTQDKFGWSAPSPRAPVQFDIFHNGQPVEAVVVGSKVSLAFTPHYAIPPRYMSVRGCQVEPIDSKYEWEREPLPIIQDGCQADLVGLVCPPLASDYGIKVTVESFRYQTTPQVQYSCLVRICPFAPCPVETCPSVDGCAVADPLRTINRYKRALSLDDIRKALEADPSLSRQIGLPSTLLQGSRPTQDLEQQLVALAGDHVVKRRLVVVNSEDQLRYYVRTGDIP